jgi:hypothetical protein
MFVHSISFTIFFSKLTGRDVQSQQMFVVNITVAQLLKRETSVIATFKAAALTGGEECCPVTR